MTRPLEEEYPSRSWTPGTNRYARMALGPAGRCSLTWASAGMATVTSWPSDWPTGRAPPVGRRLCDWVEANIEETFAFQRLPRAHHKHLKSTNLIERLNPEFKRRTLPSASSPARPAACSSSAPSPSRATKSGSKRTAASTWIRSTPTAKLKPKPPGGGEAHRLPSTLPPHPLSLFITSGHHTDNLLLPNLTDTTFQC